MRGAMVTVAAALVAAGSPVLATPAVRTISYETGPCFGTCPVYKVTVSSNGRGVFEGKRFTRVEGRRAFRVTPAEWHEFRARLQALHGHGTLDLSDFSRCDSITTDLPTVEVRWSGAWRPHVLRINYGCDGPRYGWMHAHLRRAPDALPIARFIKPDTPFPRGR